MVDAKKVDQFIKECFGTYFINYTEYFEETSDDLPRDVKAEEPQYILNMPCVETAAKVLGVDVSDILDMNDEAAMRWLKRYPYFWYRAEFNQACRRSLHDESFDRMALLEAIFETPVVPNYPTRYDYRYVLARMIDLLKSYDELLPGTYHANASIEHLTIYTQNFCHFDKIEELVNSYIDMYNRVKELFFKAWDAELSSEEVHEYNFLVASIGVYDRIYHKDGECLFYDILKEYIPIYKSEGFNDFFVYTGIWNHRVIEPWRCVEFVQNKELVQRFVEICPETKKMMREFSLQVTKFECCFFWSDAKPRISTQEELDELNYTNKMLGEDPVTFDNCGKESTLIYVPKTEEELGGDDVFAEGLCVLSGPVSLGGVSVPKRAFDFRATPEWIARVNARIEARARNQRG